MFATYINIWIVIKKNWLIDKMYHSNSIVVLISAFRLDN